MKIILVFCLFLFIVNVAVGEDKVCAPDSRWKEECNDCWCNHDGTAKACTRIGCLKSEEGLRSALVKVCEPKSRWTEKCNDCWCNDEGTAAACTRKGCLPDELNASTPA